jgi:cytidyltransferase-like protein
MKRILAVGVFDLFHVGHLRFLKYARAQGDHLSVAVTSDAIVQFNKQKTPIIKQEQRLEMIQGLSWVDHAFIVHESTANTEVFADLIAEWKINLVITGGVWEGSTRWTNLQFALAKKDIQVIYAPHTEGISSTQIVEKIKANLLLSQPNHPCHQT